MRIPKVGTLVLAEWEDSSVAEGWWSLREVEEKLNVARLCKTAGWIMKVEKDNVWIVCCAAFGANGVVELSSTTYRIPLPVIKRIVRLLAK